jgi:hypothetical protein
MLVDGLLRGLHNAHCQAQGYVHDVVVPFCKLVSTLCDRMQGALNCVENWCSEIVVFTNNRKIGSFYNPRVVGIELRMIERRILKIG